MTMLNDISKPGQRNTPLFDHCSGILARSGVTNKTRFVNPCAHPVGFIAIMSLVGLDLRSCGKSVLT